MEVPGIWPCSEPYERLRNAAGHVGDSCPACAKKRPCEGSAGLATAEAMDILNEAARLIAAERSFEEFIDALHREWERP